MYRYFCGILALGIAIECQLLFALQPFLLLRTASRYKTRWTEQPIDTISSTKLNGSPIKVNSIEPTHVRLRRSVRHSSSALRNGIQSGNALDKSTQPNQRKVSTRAHSQISLSTISEEPNDDYTSSREVIAQSQLVLETTTTSNAFASSFCSRVATCYTPNSDQNVSEMTISKATFMDNFYFN